MSRGQERRSRAWSTEDCVGSQIDQLFCERLHPIRIVAGPAKFDPEIAAFRPPQLRERISGTPQTKTARPDRSPQSRSARRSAELDRPAARAPRAAKRRPCRQKRDEFPPCDIDRHRTLRVRVTRIGSVQTIACRDTGVCNRFHVGQLGRKDPTVCCKCRIRRWPNSDLP